MADEHTVQKHGGKYQGNQERVECSCFCSIILGDKKRVRQKNIVWILFIS